MVVPNVQLAVLENCVPGEFGGTALLSTTVTLSTICCPVGIDHSAGRRIDQLWEGERVGKGHSDRDEGRPRRILFVDLVDWYEEVRATQDVRAGDRAVHEPDEIS